MDFTVPAFWAFLLLTQPQRTVFATFFACILHESAHFLAIWTIGRKPTRLRISGLGMQLSLPQTAMYGLGEFAWVMISGAAANVLAALCLCRLGHPEAAATQISLCLLNLLPYRSADGGTLLHECLTRYCPSWCGKVWRCIWLSATVLIAAKLLRNSAENAAMAAMLCYLAAAELFYD